MRKPPNWQRQRAARGTVRSANPLTGIPCPSCGIPIDRADSFCTACGHRPGNPPAAATSVRVPPPRDPEMVDWRESHQAFRCGKCGAETATETQQRSFSCPFCDSPHVVEYAPSSAGRQRPEYIIGFSITPAQAQEIFQRWLSSNGLFHPGDLASQAVTDKLRGVYLPFWSFAMQSDSFWNAKIGEHWYRQESYVVVNSQGRTETRTRTVTETEWWPLSGKYHSYHSGYLISASRGLSQQDAQLIQPFQLSALRRFETYYLAGWLCEEYSLDRQEALELCEAEFKRRELEGIRGFLPGDTQGDLQTWITFPRVSSDLCLLPIYILCYRYHGRLYRFLLNGQTGQMTGRKPYSTARIVTAIVLGVAFVAGLFFLLSLAERR